MTIPSEIQAFKDAEAAGVGFCQSSSFCLPPNDATLRTQQDASTADHFVTGLTMGWTDARGRLA